MGISCKPMGKMKSKFQKIENEQLKEQKAMNLKQSKESKKKRTSDEDQES